MDKCKIDDVIDRVVDTLSWLEDVRQTLAVIDCSLSEALRLMKDVGDMDKVYSLVEKAKNLSEEI